MKGLSSLRVFCVLLTLLVVDIPLVSGAGKKSDANDICNLKPGQELCSKVGVNQIERNSCSVTVDTNRRAGGERNQAVSICEPADRRFEFLIMFLQIMRNAK